MVKKYSQGKYVIKNPDKYIGKKQPTYRSSWEYAMMQMCDNHPSVLNWASESVRIPYFNPVSGKKTNYIPDFFQAEALIQTHLIFQQWRYFDPDR